MPRSELPPGPRAPRAVQTLGWMTRPMPYMERCRRRYGDVFTLRIAQEGSWVLLAHPDAVKQVFTGDPAVLHAGKANRILRPWMGDNSVLLLDGPDHLTQRKLLLPPFHGERMQRYGEIMRQVAEREIASWPLDEPLRLWPRMQAVTLEVIVRAIFGVHDGARMDRLRTVLREGAEMTTEWPMMLAMATLGPDRAGRSAAFRRRMDPLDELVFAEIRERRGAEDLAKREDILSLLLQARHEDGSPMSDQELRDELMTLLIAGHETTATSLSWAIERLLRHPGAMERLRTDPDYLDAVIKETLRLRPVLPIVVRQLQEPMEIAGWSLPAGTTVAPCIHLIHRREDVYPEPARFRPERFLEQAAGTYTWIPFGGGIRRCLGASFALFEMKVVLQAIADRSRLRPVHEADEPVRRRAITLTPGHGTEVVASAMAA